MSCRNEGHKDDCGILTERFPLNFHLPMIGLMDQSHCDKCRLE